MVFSTQNYLQLNIINSTSQTCREVNLQRKEQREEARGKCYIFKISAEFNETSSAIMKNWLNSNHEDRFAA